jgi:ribonucleoside-diphosphate reductase alpha chain
MDMKDLDLNKVVKALPPQSISVEVLMEKYAKGGDRSIDDVRHRVASSLAVASIPPRARS